MQTIKKVILVVICLVVLLTSFIHPAGAVNQDMLDQGWLYDESEDVYYQYPYMEMSFPSLFSLSTPNYPDINPDNLPWNEMPSYIQEIAYTPLPNMAVDTYVKVPFFLVLVTKSFIRTVCGYNLCYGRTYAVNSQILSSTCYLFSFNNLGSSAYSICYTADYDFNYDLVSDWRISESSDYGDTGYVEMYSGAGFNTSAAVDVYGYGANYGKSGNVSYFSVKADDYYNVNVVQNLNGFEAVRFLPYQDDFSKAYFQSFTPKTLSQIEAETSKGIWDSIKELPTKIADSIKGFFTSLGDRISVFFDNLKNYLLYFQETKPEYVNPFNNLLSDVNSFFDEQMSDLDDFKNSLTSTLNNVVTYIESGSGIVNSVLTAVPMLSAFVTFFVVFCIVRKVIGR